MELFHWRFYFFYLFSFLPKLSQTFLYLEVEQARTHTGIPGMHGIAVVLDAEDFLKVFDMDEEETEQPNEETEWSISC